ncbi:hypothetical protein PCO31110_01613 [Pandoraea communis]|uniref:Replicative helicase inhibitor G39P N-terminal domain-containing protein n=1 Tax=Pandoraea communis TaxID=2508297 RepID=A0A5E4TUH3_9BURK|nr:hypothetical protein [Pandoraea communis]VVD90882.1 hypothetical protein PCO31110_01613 [Pandoraea communis]
MSEDDFDAFAELLDAAYSLHGKSLAPTAKAMFFRALMQYPLAVVRQGIDAAIKDPVHGRFAPKPADIIAQISGNDGRPEADEAWSMSLAALSEQDTVVWTSEMQQAFEIARPVLNAGDKIGARMAFKDAYTRLLSQARAQGARVQWSASLGWDKESAEVVLREAQRIGRLPAPAVAALLPPPLDETPPSEKQLEGLAQVKAFAATLVSPLERKRKEREEAERVRREAEESRKAQFAEAVASYEGAKQ